MNASILLCLWLGATCLQEFTIKLDGAEYDKFREPALYLKAPAIKFINELLLQVKGDIVQRVKGLYGLVKQNYPSKALEIKGVADALEFDEETIFVFQYIYEIYTYCTSIIMRRADNSIFVGRNLDYMFVDDLAKTHYIAVFTVQNKELFRCTNYAGFIGVSTCLKKNKYIITLNSRYSLLNTTLEDNYNHFVNGANLVTWAIRDAMEKTSSFNELKTSLENAHIVSPAYFNIAGTSGNEGCVINRERDSNKGTICLNESLWYIVQVNTDYDVQVPHGVVDRRLPAQKALDAIGNAKVDYEYVKQSILYLYPNYNYLTIFSSILDANNGVFDVQLWGKSSMQKGII